MFTMSSCDRYIFHKIRFYFQAIHEALMHVKCLLKIFQGAVQTVIHASMLERIQIEDLQILTILDGPCFAHSGS